MANDRRPSLLDPDFKYTPSVETDIRKRFAKELRRLAAEKKAEEAKKVPAHNVKPLIRLKGA